MDGTDGKGLLKTLLMLAAMTAVVAFTWKKVR